MIDAPMPEVELRGIAGVQFTHAVTQPLVADLDYEVVVVPHQRIGEDDPAVFASDVVDSSDEIFAVGVVDVDVALVVAAADDVMESGRLIARLVRHNPTVRTSRRR